MGVNQNVQPCWAFFNANNSYLVNVKYKISWFLAGRRVFIWHSERTARKMFIEVTVDVKNEISRFKQACSCWYWHTEIVFYVNLKIFMVSSKSLYLNKNESIKCIYEHYFPFAFLCVCCLDKVYRRKSRKTGSFIFS